MLDRPIGNLTLLPWNSKKPQISSQWQRSSFSLMHRHSQYTVTKSLQCTLKGSTVGHLSQDLQNALQQHVTVQQTDYWPKNRTRSASICYYEQDKYWKTSHRRHSSKKQGKENERVAKQVTGQELILSGSYLLARVKEAKWSFVRARDWKQCKTDAELAYLLLDWKLANIS